MLGKNITAAHVKAMWLFSLCVMLWIMVVIGGLTRLTESGLSMTDWKPITGWLPPLTNKAWMDEFNAYRQSPEYLKINKGMNLSEFKGIFWLEYIHRVWGRLMALALVIPILWMAFKKWLQPKEYALFLGFFVLGGMQGLIGWIMVQSGLVDRPDVSPYKLTMHLTMALILFSLLWWTALSYYFYGKEKPALDSKKKLTFVFTLLLFVQIGFGGMMAGSNAGYIYNTWPLMDGSLLPLHLDGLIANVQIVHRSLAYLVFGLGVFLWWCYRRHPIQSVRYAANGLGLFIFVQFVLGIATLLTVVNIALASAHQAIVVWVLASAISLNFFAKAKTKDT